MNNNLVTIDEHLLHTTTIHFDCNNYIIMKHKEITSIKFTPVSVQNNCFNR